MTTPCIHRWIINKDNIGTCQNCGATKQYLPYEAFNSFSKELDFKQRRYFQNGLKEVKEQRIKRFQTTVIW
jgi:hypothetical protein